MTNLGASVTANLSLIDNKQEPAELRADILRHVTHTLGTTAGDASLSEWRVALCLAVRDRIVDCWAEALQAARQQKSKRVYYLSMEFLIGRLLQDAIVNLQLEDQAQSALQDIGLNFADVIQDEPDAALGNGGLGRLAACFLESL